MGMNPFVTERDSVKMPDGIRRYGEYVVTTETEHSENFADIVAACMKELIKQKKRAIEENGLIEVQGSLEMIVKSWPDAEKPIGYSIAMKYRAKDEGKKND